MSVLTRVAAVSRRPATVADGEYLRELYAESRDDLWVLPDDVRTVLLDTQFRNRRHELEAAHPRSSYEIVLVDGAAAGLLILERGPDRVHVVQLALARGHRHHGVAESVLTQVRAEAGPLPVTR